MIKCSFLLFISLYAFIIKLLICLINKKTKMFKEGDIVWAKIDGYPWWPSYVEKKLPEDKYTVLFLGEKSFQTVKKDKIKDWSENYRACVDKVRNVKKTQKFFVSVELGINLKAGVISYEQHNEFLSNCLKKRNEYSIEGVKQFCEVCKLNKNLKKDIKKTIDTFPRAQLCNKNKISETISRDVLSKEVINKSKIINKGNAPTPKKPNSPSTPIKIVKPSINKVKTAIPLSQIRHLNFSNDLLQICLAQSTIEKNMSYIYSQLEKLNGIKDKCGHLNFNSKEGNIELKKEVLLYLEFICSVYQIPFEVNASLKQLLSDMKKIDSINP